MPVDRPEGALVGRADELALLDRALADARAGVGRCVLLRGGAWVGKTALLDLVTSRAEGFTVLRATCDQARADTPYAIANTLLPTARDLPELWEQAASLARSGPLLVVVDDAHWCDSHTLVWLNFLLRRGAGLPLLVLIARRAEATGQVSELLAEAAAHSHSSVLRVRPLAESTVAELLHREFGEPPAPSFTRLCRAMTGGVPALLARLVADLRAEGVHPSDQHTEQAASLARHRVARWVVPSLFGGSRSAWAVLRALAVLGRADEQLLTALSGFPARAVAAVVEDLRRYVGPERDWPRPVLAGALTGLTGAELTCLRARAARLLNDVGSAPEAVADQLVQLPVLEQTWMLPVLEEAADSAVRRGDSTAAVLYLQRLLEADGGTTELRLKLAEELSQTDPAAARRHLWEALQASEDLRDRARVGAAFESSGLVPEQPDLAMRGMTETLARLDEQEVELRAGLESALLSLGAQHVSNLPRFLSSVRERTPALAGARGLAARALEATISARCAESAARDALAALAEGGDELGDWWTRACASVVHLAGDSDAAVAALTARLARSGRSGDFWSYCQDLSIRSMFRQESGYSGAAKVDSQTAAGIVDSRQWHGLTSLPQLARASVVLEQGDVHGALAVLDALHLPTLRGLAWEFPTYLMVRGHARWMLGDRDTAARCFLDCGRYLADAGISNPAVTLWWLDLTYLLDELGRVHEAAEYVAEQEQRVLDWGTPKARGSWLLAKAVLVGGTAGVEHATEAVEVLTGSQARMLESQAKGVLGRHLLRLGEVKAARGHLRQAADLAVRNGSPVMAQSARNLLLAAGGRMPEVAASPEETLTDRERLVADLAGAGSTNREIATELCVTLRTVESHLTNVYRKLGVSTRRELAAKHVRLT
ncbi:hypothetical protein GCM10010174_04590 [Kutzneria viridogrisea]|uniref:DNA-binding CsgD family transcriptional regulator n=1 Tax=Kutzneria viridogrisea TaxID=47990 RepID=A0ABR6BEK4_9PSEU|nr:DNA-binding CsgD family transcriptional regulator [Kutzneria viridogrisea]